MNHDELAALVSDWVRGALPAARAESMGEHVRGCADCQAVAAAVRALEQAKERTATRAAGHPDSDRLASYVIAAATEPIENLALVGIHIQECADCHADVSLMRAAAHPGWWRRLRVQFGSRAWESMPALAPALAICVLLLAYPAWRGISREDATRTPSPRGGGVSALVLQETVRAETDLPTLRLRATQTLQPLLLDVAPRSDILTINLVREPDEVVWSITGPSSEFWDQENRLLGVMVPVAAMTAGIYRVELSSAEAAQWFSTRFRVAP